MGKVHSSVPNFTHRASELGPSFRNKSGNLLKSRRISVSDPKAIIFSFPGMGSHSWCQNDFDPLIARCQSRGINLLSLDHAGHGYSEGPRNLIPDKSSTFEDAVNFIHLSLENEPDDIPFFLMGFSLGGLCALKVGLKLQEMDDKRFKGVITLAPCVKEIISPRREIREFIRYTLLHLSPKLTLPGVCSIDPSKCYRDPESLKILSEDRLRYCGSSGLPIGNIMLLDAMKEFRQNDISKIEYPFLVVHGDADIVTPLCGSELLVSTARSDEKSLCVYKNVPHCIVADPDFYVIWNNINDWMERRLGYKLDRNLHG